MTELPRTPPRIAASLVDPLTYAEAHGLHNDFTWLRANLPLSRAEVNGFDPFWVVTKHADIAEISRQNALFHNGDRPTTLTDCRERGVRPQAHRHAASRAQPGADGRAGSSEVSRADAAVVHEPERAQAGGAHPRHRARAGRQHDRARRRVRLRARRRGDVSAARHHGDPRRAARGRAAHADADAAAVRQPGSGAEPLAPGRPRHGGNGEAAAGRGRRLLRVLPQAHRVAARASRATTSPR